MGFFLSLKNQTHTHHKVVVLEKVVHSGCKFVCFFFRGQSRPKRVEIGSAHSLNVLFCEFFHTVFCALNLTQSTMHTTQHTAAKRNNITQHNTIHRRTRRPFQSCLRKEPVHPRNICPTTVVQHCWQSLTHSCEHQRQIAPFLCIVRHACDVFVL